MTELYFVGMIQEHHYRRRYCKKYIFFLEHGSLKRCHIKKRGVASRKLLWYFSIGKINNEWVLETKLQVLTIHQNILKL
jgi:hypothetical protein